MQYFSVFGLFNPLNPPYQGDFKRNCVSPVHYSVEKYLEVIITQRQNALESFDIFVTAPEGNRVVRDQVLVDSDAELLFLPAISGGGQGTSYQF